MRRIRTWLRQEETHEGMSMVVVSILTSSTENGWMQSAGNDRYGIYIPDFVGTVSDVKGLNGKPKIFFINACHKGLKF